MKSRILDFRTYERPSLTVTLLDEENTVLNVTTPTEALVEEMKGVGDALKAAFDKKDAGAVEALYDFAARLMSCNRENVAVTGAELKGKYKLDLEAVTIFYSEYTEFVNDIRTAKN